MSDRFSNFSDEALISFVLAQIGHLPNTTQEAVNELVSRFLDKAEEAMILEDAMGMDGDEIREWIDSEEDEEESYGSKPLEKMTLGELMQSIEEVAKDRQRKYYEDFLRNAQFMDKDYIL